MAQDMHAHSWRSRVAAHLAPMKEYLPHHQHQHLHPNHHSLTTEAGCVDGDAKKHSWSQFASRMFAKRSLSDPDSLTSIGMERIVLLPGWASRRYRDGPELPNRTGTTHLSFYIKGTRSWFAGAPYDIEVFVSGYVVKHKAQTLSRSQRKILGLAKRSLPYCFACSVRAERLIRYRLAPEASGPTSRRCRGPSSA